MQTISVGFEIESDGKTVWVNGPDGMCVGRFSSKFGMDVHRDLEGQANAGQCLHCTHEPPDLATWREFQGHMLIVYGVAVSDSHRPRLLEDVKKAA